MRTTCFVCGWPGLATARNCVAKVVCFCGKLSSELRSVLWFAGLALVLSGCASHRHVVRHSDALGEISQPQVCRFGTIALANDSAAASFSFRKAKGKLGSAKDAIVESAEMGLSGPGAGVIVVYGVLFEDTCGNIGAEPFTEVAVAGAMGGITALAGALAGPVVGAEGLYRSLRKVSPAELAERVTVLTNALSHMAEQQHFRGALLDIGAKRIRGGFLQPDTDGEQAMAAGANMILDAQVDDLRLDRAGTSEGSYFLRIKTHAVLVRVSDGVVYYAESAEYRSGKDLFLDWTDKGAVELVAETGYQALARHYIHQLLARP